MLKIITRNIIIPKKLVPRIRTIKAKFESMNGIFAIEKPSGITSTKYINDLQNIFTESKVFASDLNAAKALTKSQLDVDKKWTPARIDKRIKSMKVKIGHGGTLDPLAKGVLIIGIGLGTKKLQHYLTGCNKTYEAKALLGMSTTTGDSEGEIISQSPIEHITKEQIKNTAPKFIGKLRQTPPIFSALKMNGKPLYDYAREGKPLPMPIKPREVTIHDIKVHEEDSLSYNHNFEKLESKLDEDGKPIEHLLSNNPTLNDSPLFFSQEYLENENVVEEDKIANGFNHLKENESLPDKLPMFHITAGVSSGTYIRSLLSDYGRALNSAAYMVELNRVSQSDWKLGKNTFTLSDFTDRDEEVWGKILKKVFDNGPEIDLAKEFETLESQVATTVETNEEESKKRSIDEVEN